MNFHSYRFRVFIASVIFLFACCIILIFTALFYGNLSTQLTEQVINTSAQQLSFVATSFDKELVDINLNLTEISMKASTQDAVSSDFEINSLEHLQYAMVIKRDLTDMVTNDGNLLESVYALNKDFYVYYNNNMVRSYTKEEMMSSHYFNQLSTSAINQWVCMPMDTLSYASQSDQLSLIKIIYKNSIVDSIGYLVANIPFDRIDAYFSSAGFPKSTSISLYNKNFQALFHPNGTSAIFPYEEIQSNIEKRSLNGYIITDTMLVTYQCADSGRVYLAEIPMAEVLSPLSSIKQIVFVITAMSLLISLSFSIFLSHSIFSPIKILLLHMKRHGNGEERVQISHTRTDEIGYIFHQFNRMSTKLDTLINNLYKEELLSKELQLNNAREQINPHFLYNTLDTIHWSAREGDMNKVCTMISLLSVYFRKRLSDGRDFISISETVDVIHSYLEIQKIRHAEKFEYTIHYPESLSDYLIPRHLYQPLVENAISHGLNKKSGQGFCCIQWKHVHDSLEFSVSDNGVGIDVETLARLKSELADSEIKAKGCFALKNINLQLKLRYGIENGLHIESSSRGTCVSFAIPFESKEGADI